MPIERAEPAIVRIAAAAHPAAVKSDLLGFGNLSTLRQGNFSDFVGMGFCQPF